MKNESRDKDLRLQSLQSKVCSFPHPLPPSNISLQLNHLRERSRTEDDRNSKEKDMVNPSPLSLPHSIN